MNIAAVIIAGLAAVCFLVEFARTQSLICLGLAAFVVAFVLAFVVQGGPAWVIH